MAATATEHRKSAPPADKQLAVARQLRVPLTQARPSRTLFGSVLERLSDAELAAAVAAASKSCDDAATTTRRREAPQVLPPEMAAFVRAKHAPDIERHARDVDNYRRRLRLRDQRLGLMERDSKYVFDLPHPVESLPAPTRDYGPRPRWMTADDVSHAAEVNPHFLAPGVASFNRDKYRRLPESHSYALAGDPLRPGMEFDRAPVELPPPAAQPQLPKLPPANARPDRLVLTPRTEQRQQAMRRLPPSVQTINGVQVPMRLKHQFGSELCEALLADREAVLASSRRMQQRDRASGRASDATGADGAAAAAASLETGNASYEQLGNALRTNVFGQGYSVNQRVSSNHLDFSRAQFAQREPVPDLYRYQKDHVSRWAEANVLEMRMKKALQERMDRMLHKRADD